MGTAIPSSLMAAIEGMETMLLWPGPEVSDAELDRLVAEDFHEIGASGRRFDREYGLSVLRERRTQLPEEAWVRSDQQVHELQPGLVLLTYRLQRGDKTSMRSTLWRRTLDGGWQAVFHQGTSLGG